MGGVLIDGHVRWALAIPRLGSLIARGSLNAPVPGLDGVPPQDRPPVNATHLAFQSMVGIGTLLALVVIVYWLTRWRGRDLLQRRWFLWVSVICGPLAAITLEFGWTATELGRQPWTVWHVLRTWEAASMNSGLWWTYAEFL